MPQPRPDWLYAPGGQARMPDAGRNVTPDSAALNEIASLLDRADWSGDDLAAIADIVRATGREVRDLED